MRDARLYLRQFRILCRSHTIAIWISFLELTDQIWINELNAIQLIAEGYPIWTERMNEVNRRTK